MWWLYGKPFQRCRVGRLESGLEAIAVIPHTAPRIKVEVDPNLGAQVILHGQNYDEAYEEALQIAEERVHGFSTLNDPDVMAGQERWLWNSRARPDVVDSGGGGAGRGQGS